MEFKQTVQISLRALKVNKLRSFLTSLGIIIGVASVVILLAIGSGLKLYITQQFEALGSNLIIVFPGEFVQQGANYSLTQEAAFFDYKFTSQDVQNLKKRLTDIKGVAPMIRKAARAKYNKEEKTVLSVGTSANYIILRQTEIEKGRFFQSSEVKNAKKVVVLGHKIAQDLFGPTNPLGKQITLADYKFKVIGIAEKKGQGTGMGMNIDELIYLPVTTAQKIFDLTKYNAILIGAKNEKAIPALKKQVKRILITRLDEDDFSVVETEEILKTIQNVLGVFSAALGGIAAISLLVGGIGIMNIMFVSVTERTREIGLRKAVGAKPKDILLQFLCESVVLSIGGGIVGLILAWLATKILNRFFPAQITYWSVLLAFFVSTGVGVFFGVFPARKAAKLDPIDALRYE